MKSAAPAWIDKVHEIVDRAGRKDGIDVLRDHLTVAVRHTLGLVDADT